MEKLASSIDNFICGELLLPQTERALITRCPILQCSGELLLSSYEKLFLLRKRPARNEDIEDNALKCSRCNLICSVSSRIDAALDHGYHRCFGRPRLNTVEVIDLIFKGLPARPKNKESNEYDCWLLNLSSIQVLVNVHDRKHRKSCFKSESSSCRYNTPHEPVTRTALIPIYASEKEVSTTSITATPNIKD